MDCEISYQFRQQRQPSIKLDFSMMGSNIEDGEKKEKKRRKNKNRKEFKVENCGESSKFTILQERQLQQNPRKREEEKTEDDIGVYKFDCKFKYTGYYPSIPSNNFSDTQESSRKFEGSEQAVDSEDEATFFMMTAATTDKQYNKQETKDEEWFDEWADEETETKWYF